MMDFLKVIRDFDGILNGLEGTTRDILNAADPNSILKLFRTYEGVFSDCKTMGSLRETSPTTFVASISRKLHSITLLEVDYESNCAVKYLATQYSMWPKNVAVMLPDTIYRPFLRYRISEQMAKLTPDFPWSIKMVPSSNIEKWITRDAAEHLETFAENIKSIPLAFPNRQEIAKIIKESIDAMDHANFTQRAFYTHLEHENRDIGDVTGKPYVCHWSFTVSSLKDQLVKKTFDGIAEDIGEMVARKITEYILERLNSSLKLGMGRLRNLVSSDTFQKVLVITLKGALLTSLVIILASILGFMVATAITVVAFSITLLLPVDVNSYDWRRKVAEEMYGIFSKERENIKKKICETAPAEVESKLKELKDSIMSCYKETCNLKRQLQMASHSSWIEIFSQKDFEKMTDISSFAEEYGKTHSCLECIGCVGIKDQVECDILGGKRRLEGGSVVVVSLQKEINDESHEGDFPLVKLPIQRQHEEHDKIFHFHEQHDLLYIDDEIYGEIRNKLDNELLRSFSRKHSNLVAIDICTTKSRNGGKYIEACTCIVIFCFAKGFIPIGENFFPKEIGGIPTDVREAYALPFGTRDFNHLIGPGCSVGLKDSMSSGSIGFLLRHKDDGHFAFVSAAHVFFNFSLLRKYADGDEDLKLEEYKVVQPSDADNESMVPVTERICGHVRSIHFNSTDEENCKDLIVVVSEKSRHPRLTLRHPSISETSKQQSGCHNWPDGYNINDIGIQEGSIGKSVLKVGRTTDLTTGRYVGQHVMVTFRVNGTSYHFYDMLKIRAHSHEDFSQNGDSGAGIYLRIGNTLKPFAILEGSKMKGETLAIPASVIKTFCPDYDIQTFLRTNFRNDNE